MRRAPNFASRAARRWPVQAIETADRPGALAFKLRAATDLGRVFRDQHRLGEARDLLTRVYGQFTEGRDTPDLKDAKVLLDDLNASGIPDQ